jgi:hypothetical protein
MTRHAHRRTRRSRLRVGHQIVLRSWILIQAHWRSLNRWTYRCSCCCSRSSSEKPSDYRPLRLSCSDGYVNHREWRLRWRRLRQIQIPSSLVSELDSIVAGVSSIARVCWSQYTIPSPSSSPVPPKNEETRFTNSFIRTHQLLISS